MPTNVKFGYVFSAIFATFFLYFYFKKGGGLLIFFGSLTALLFLFTIFASSKLEPLNRAWYKFGLLLGRITSPIILIIIFFFLITPYALVMRFFGRDALLLKRRQVSSYWVDREPIEPDSFKDQF